MIKFSKQLNGRLLIQLENGFTLTLSGHEVVCTDKKEQNKVQIIRGSSINTNSALIEFNYDEVDGVNSDPTFPIPSSAEEAVRVISENFFKFGATSTVGGSGLTPEQLAIISGNKTKIESLERNELKLIKSINVGNTLAPQLIPDLLAPELFQVNGNAYEVSNDVTLLLLVQGQFSETAASTIELMIELFDGNNWQVVDKLKSENVSVFRGRLSATVFFKQGEMFRYSFASSGTAGAREFAFIVSEL